MRRPTPGPVRLLPGLALLAVVGGGGCQSYVFEQKCTETVTEARLEQAVAVATPVDILFVIDNSGSMADEQENLVRNFGAFIDVIAGSTLDYRIAVVTTDLGSNGSRPTDGPEVAGVASFVVNQSSPYREVDSSDRSDCRTLATAHGCFRGGGDPPWLDSERDEPAAIVSRFGETALVGTCGSGLERGTTAMLEALERTEDGGCNQGFLRAEANLVVIVVSDEDDFDPEAAPEILRRLGEVKPLERVRFALIGGIVDGMPSTCRTGPDGDALAMCGSLCDERDRPPLDDQGPCGPGGSCEPFYECRNVSGRSRCVSVGWVGWANTGTGFGCDSCSSFAVDTCCAADVGAQAYFTFATALEAEVARLDPAIAVTGCSGANGSGRPACLVDSICQAEFAGTLQRIARDLVVSTRIALAPPARYPPGVTVRITGGRFGDAPRTLVNCASVDPGEDCDFEVSADGTAVQLRSAELLPRDDESLEVFFAIDDPDPAPPTGACGA